MNPRHAPSATTNATTDVNSPANRNRSQHTLPAQMTPSLIQRAYSNPSQLQPHELLSVQRTLGNQATARLLDGARNSGSISGSANQPLATSQGIIQAKSQVRPANDRYEQEADHITNTIMREVHQPSTRATSTPEKSLDSANQATPSQETGVQRSVIQPSMIQPSMIQRSGGNPAGRQGGTLDEGTEGRLQRAQKGGSALPETIRRTLEPKLGADLSTVKVHTGNESAGLNRAMGAKAFTHKNHIFYGAGQSPSDLSLTAHEAVHTVQQGAVQRTPQNAQQQQPDKGGAQQIQRTKHEPKANAFYSEILPGQRITQENAVITATAFNNFGGGHAAIYVEALTKGKDPQRDDVKIHLTYNRQSNTTIINLEHGRVAREPRKRSWVTSAANAARAVERAEVIANEPQKKKKYKYFGGSLTSGGMNCAKFGERILKAAGIKASAGIIFKTPKELASGKNVGHEDTLEQDISDYRQKRREEKSKLRNQVYQQPNLFANLNNAQQNQNKAPKIQVDPEERQWLQSVIGKDFQLTKELPGVLCNREGHGNRGDATLPTGTHIYVAKEGDKDGEAIIEGPQLKTYRVNLALLYDSSPHEDN